MGRIIREDCGIDRRSGNVYYILYLGNRDRGVR